MELINILHSYALVGIWFLIFFARLLFSHASIKSSIAACIQEFKKGYHSYPLCLRKIKKKYSIRLLLFLSALLQGSYLVATISNTYAIPVAVKMGLLLLIIYASVILLSYAVLSCYELLTHGTIKYRAIFMHTGEIVCKVIPVVLFSFLYEIIVNKSFLYEQEVAGISYSPISELLAIDNLWVSLTTIALLFLLVDKRSIKEASTSSLRTTYTIWPTLSGLGIGWWFDFMACIFFAIPLFLAGAGLRSAAAPFFVFSFFYGAGYFLLLYIRLRILSCLVIMIVAYWLYGRKKQTVPFGKEYIESLEG